MQLASEHNRNAGDREKRLAHSPPTRKPHLLLAYAINRHV
jgi:hypothetical protein